MAEDHLNKIRTEHADILSSMVSHQAKVEQYNQQKEAERIANEEKQRVSMKEEAERQAKMKELLQPRIEYYQATGKNYKELHIGDLFEKRILK